MCQKCKCDLFAIMGRISAKLDKRCTFGKDISLLFTFSIKIAKNSSTLTNTTASLTFSFYDPFFQICLFSYLFFARALVTQLSKKADIKYKFPETKVESLKGNKNVLIKRQNIPKNIKILKYNVSRPSPFYGKLKRTSSFDMHSPGTINLCEIHANYVIFFYKSDLFL